MSPARRASGTIGSRRRVASTPAVWQNPPPITVAQALDASRPQVVPGAGPYPKYTFYNQGTPTVNTTYAAPSDYDIVGFMAYDAEHNTSYCGTLYGALTPAVCSDADRRANTRPFRAGLTNPRAGIAVVRGLFRSDTPNVRTWTEMKHGRDVQIAWNTDPNAPGSNPTSDGNALTLGMLNGSWWYIDGIRVYQTMDGINLRGNNGTVGSHGICYVKNTYIGRARDTAFTSEQGHLFRAFDCLVEDSYGMIDMQGYATNMSSLYHVWEYCLIRLQKLPGGFKWPDNTVHHDKIWKSDANSPKGKFLNCTIAVEDPDENPNFDTSALSEYTGSTLCWLGAGAYPWTPPSGLTVLTGQAAIDHWDGKRSSWASRHGFSAYNSVDHDLMINAAAPAA